MFSLLLLSRQGGSKRNFRERATGEQSCVLAQLTREAITTTSPLSATSSPIHRRIAEEAVSSYHSASECSGPLLGRASARPAPSPPAAEFLRYVPRHAPTPRRRWSPSPVACLAADYTSQWLLPSSGVRMGWSIAAGDGAGIAPPGKRARGERRRPALKLASGRSALTSVLAYRRATPPPSSTPSLAAMPPMLRLPPLRSPLSSSRGSAVSRRSLVSPRPAVSSPSGTQKQ